ncbi:HAD family hydrolase [Calidifontibacillus erzurumensis]|uniref:HAD family hydrolase n=1 Tax=Calidifontibacillus erzurumensis TaxID=2741433 RepID=A0A8J8GC05_9BACI|nr:HAD family hydrolase [Calidifontibacillus erzurumensis]NSL50897.1 HAD family hydrolase [Calidifontibacillus erzurumensis]
MTNTPSVKAIVFDLDGTLYEETAHFDYYANRIKDKLPDEKQNLFMRDYQLAVNFEHPLQIGRIYDVENDLILVEQNGRIIEAYKWNGEPVVKEKLSQLYPNKITIDYKRMLNIGDLWWVPISIGAHYGALKEQSQQAFLETRDYMMSDQFKMKPIPGLKDLLEFLYKDIHLTLLTNSPEPDSEVILKKLGIDHLFHKKIFNGKKPVKTKKWFEQLRNEVDVKFSEILSVGDNEVNDIKPVSELGCQTIYIDTYQLGKKTTASYVVNKMSEAIPIIDFLTISKIKR